MKIIGFALLAFYFFTASVRLARAESDVILNGGFESNAIWTTSGATIQTSSPGFAHSGNGYLAMGAVASTTQFAYQTVSLPTNIIQANLSFYLNVFSPSRSSSEVFSLAVGDTNGNTPNVLFNATGVNSAGGEGSGNYSKQTINLSGLAGRTFRIYFVAQMSALGVTTTFAVDDVSLPAALTTDAPPNDYFTNRIALTGTNISVKGTNSYASKEDGEPNHAGNAGGKSLWWSWVAPTNGSLTVNTSNTAFSDLLAVYTGTSVDSLTRIASQAASSSRDSIARVKLNVTTGTEYEIAVGGEDGDSGVVNLNLSFIAKPFALVKGAYAGLFAESDQTRLNSAGFLTLQVTDAGKFSGKVQFAGSSVSISGTFAGDGSFSKIFSRGHATPLIVQLQTHFDGSGTITGTIGDGTWTAGLLANQNSFTKLGPAPESGKKYTLGFNPADDASTAPGGYSVASVMVANPGIITVSGTLGDTTILKQKTFLSGSSTFPLFQSLYGGSGMVMGWVDLSSGAPQGRVAWLKSAQAKSKFYPMGFDLPALDLVGSAFFLPAHTQLFSWSSGNLVLQNGNLSTPVTNSVSLAAGNKFSGPNKLSLSISTATGLMKGKVNSPQTGKPISFNGAIFQSTDAAVGSFSGTNQTGSVQLAQ